MDQLISDTTFIFLDTETTGDAPYRDKIIELSAIKVRGDEILGSFDHLIDPQIQIPEISTEITGITQDMVRGKPKFRDIADDFLAFLGSDIVVAHNADFDRQFVNHELMMAGKPTINNGQICTWKLSKRILPKQEKYSLEYLADSYGINKGSAHRALDDTKTAWKVFLKMMDIMRQRNLTSFAKLREIHQLSPAKCRELYFPREEMKTVNENQNSLF